MSPLVVPTYKVKEIESAADAFLREKLGTEIDIPVDVDYLVESLPGVSLDIRRGLRSRMNLDGAVLRDIDTSELVIWIDEHIADKQENRYRSTVAEELGHILLHRQVIDSITTVAEFAALQEHPQRGEMERNVKRFAAAILMPGKEVIARAESLYPKVVSAISSDTPEAIEAVLRQMAIMLAKQFRVSTQTMGYRLDEWPVRIKQRVQAATVSGLKYLPSESQ